jgi:hypothetical protein
MLLLLPTPYLELQHYFSPLRNLLRKDVEFCWSQEHNQALAELKDLLINHGTLHFPDINKSFSIVTDAWKSAAAHVLLQEKNGVQQWFLTGRDV